MRFLPYILRHLKHTWLRTVSTVFAMMLCVFLFCTLQTVIGAVSRGLESANAARLVVRHAVSLVFSLPVSYGERIAAIPGVKLVAKSNWFGGSRGTADNPDFRNFFTSFAVDAEPYFQMYPEYIVPPDEMKAFMADQQGCVIGRELARKYGWKIGDTFSLESFIPPYRKGSPFEYVVRAIYDTDEKRFPGSTDSFMFFHFKYLYEGTAERSGVGTYAVLLDDPSKAGAVSKAIDALFENSDRETHSETEMAFRAGFLSMAGNLAFLLNAIGIAVTFTILLVTANTMSMAVRERRKEIAVLKTIGFSSRLVMTLILAEAFILGLVGGGLGVALSPLMIKALPSFPIVGDSFRGLEGLGLGWDIAALGIGVSLFMAFAAGLVPSLVAYRARVTEMLRHV